MNYIRHLHAFYHQVRRDDRLTATHVSLYMAIFQYWNYNRFQNPFRIDRDELMQLSKIGSVTRYRKCIKELHDYRYVFYHSGIKKYQDAKLSIIRLDTSAEEKGLKQLDLFVPPQPVVAQHSPNSLAKDTSQQTRAPVQCEGNAVINTTSQIFEKNKTLSMAITKLANDQ